jgi:hypothetical protein
MEIRFSKSFLLYMVQGAQAVWLLWLVLLVTVKG